MLWLFKLNFRGFRRFLIHGNSSYVVLYTPCLRYNICSAWFLDIRLSTCLLRVSRSLYLVTRSKLQIVCTVQMSVLSIHDTRISQRTQ